MSKPVDRGLHLLHLGRASKRKEQHPWRRRESERGPDRVSDSDGRRHQAARPGEERAEIPARGG